MTPDYIEFASDYPPNDLPLFWSLIWFSYLRCHPRYALPILLTNQFPTIHLQRWSTWSPDFMSSPQNYSHSHSMPSEPSVKSQMLPIWLSALWVPLLFSLGSLLLLVTRVLNGSLFGSNSDHWNANRIGTRSRPTIMRFNWIREGIGNNR